MKLPRPASTSPGSVLTRRRRPLLLALLAVLVLALLPTPARADDGPGRPSSSVKPLSFRESGCTEIAYYRGGLESAVRPLVPERFALQDFPDGLPEGAPPRVYLIVNEVTCDRGRFPGRGGQRHYTYLIVSAFVTATEGDQRDGVYVLFFATESRAQRAAFRRLGWPVVALSKKTTAQVARDGDGAAVGAALHVVGGGWDHDVVAVRDAPTPSPTASTAEYYRDTTKGPQAACFANLGTVTTAVYSGDLRSTPFASVAYVPPLFTGYPGFLVSGGWDVVVKTGGCPSSPASSRQPLRPDLRPSVPARSTGGDSEATGRR